MCPVVQWISHGIWNRFRPFLKFCKIIRISGNEVFINSIGSHSPPFIMIAIQPDLCQVFKFSVRSDIFRREMTMVIDDGHFSRMVMIQLFSSFIFQNEIFIQKLFHSWYFISLTNKKRLDVPFKNIFCHIFSNNVFVLIQRIEIGITKFGSYFIPAMK